jgi:citrate lyase beta subunit
MNKTEIEMSEILTTLKNDFGCISVKAEFEAEGTRMDELLRLIDIARHSDVKLTVKIGGCEALRDLLEAKQLGVDFIVAPMVESGYAASKYVSAKNIVFASEERKYVEFYLNLETISAYNNLNDLISESTIEDGLDGIVFGRVDFVGSLREPRTNINLPSTTKYIKEVAAACKKNNLKLIMGGGVSIDSIHAIREVASIHLNKFETRKIVFDTSTALNSNIELGLIKAVRFELLWLLNKRDYYTGISVEDNKRIDMLQDRAKELQEKAKK